MRILHVTDFHYHQPWFDWLSRNAVDFDAVALTGDLLDLSKREPIERQIAWVQHWIREFPGQLMICSGNHDALEGDSAAWLARGATNKVLVDGQHLALGAWSFEAVGWGSLPSCGGENQIALVHCPPEQAETAIHLDEATDWGDFELHELLVRGPAALRPRLVLSGHVHRPRRWYHRFGRTWSFNPGVGVHREVPNHIELDLERGIAIWCRANRPDEFVRWTDQADDKKPSD
ncbi:MAG: metallophosphoesterase [Opitutaceae bacterium]|nr:metallophosphoesterase [Opitutaceae bacterium]